MARLPGKEKALPIEGRAFLCADVLFLQRSVIGGQVLIGAVFGIDMHHFDDPCQY